jgi:protein-S-isoprenylcysteine O-methyltransferase Ste14
MAHMKNLNIPPVWTLVAVALTMILHLSYPLILIRFRAIDLGIIAIGLYLIVAPIVWLRKYRTTVVPRQKPTKLVVEGPFRLSRNPMYLGMVLVTFGFAMSLGSLQSFIPSVWLFLFLNKNYVLPEERKLREAMGQEAEEYFARTGRWIWFL